MRFGFTSLTCLVVASTIGAGVYTTSGYTLRELGTPSAVLMTWLGAALLALSGALSFAALARALPYSGGEYLFLSRLLHPAAGFIAGWVSLLAGFAGAQAYGVLAMAEYLPFPETLEKVVGSGLILFLAVAQGVLTRLGTALQNLAVVLKAVFLAKFILVGWFLLPPATAASQTRVPVTAGWDTWAYAVLMVSLSYTGFNAAIYVAEECEDPRRDIPRALFWGTIITAILYLAVNAVFVYSGPLEALMVPGIAVASAELLGGPALAEGVRVLVLLSLFTLVSGTAVSGPRVVKKMGEDGYLPLLTLGQASAVQCVISITMTWWSDLFHQLGYLSLILSLISAATVAMVFRLPRQERPHPIWPGIYLLGTAITSVAALRVNPSVGWGALATILAGLGAYVLVGRTRRQEIRA